MLYLHLFGPKRWLRWTCYLVLIITFLFYWVNIPLTGVYCVPHSGRAWTPEILSSCSKLAIMGPIHGTVGVAADLVIFCLPLPIVHSLNLPPRKRIGLAVVFLVGILYVRRIWLRLATADVQKRCGCQQCIAVLPRENLHWVRSALEWL